MTVRVHGIVLAGGDGNRFGGELPKQFVRLAGDPILLRTLRCLRGASLDQLVVVAHPSWIDATRELIAGAGLDVPVDGRRGRGDPQREHPERPRGARCRRRRHRARPRRGPAARCRWT